MRSTLTFVDLDSRDERGQERKSRKRFGRSVGNGISQDRRTPNPCHLKAKRVRFGSPVRLLARSPFPPDYHQLFIFLRRFFTRVRINNFRQNREISHLTSFIPGAPEIMPVQTQTRTQPAPSSDPFHDPNSIKLVSPPPPKVPSKRDAATGGHRETTNTRSQDPHRAKPVRSQTHQNVGSVGHSHVRYSRSVFIVSTFST